MQARITLAGDDIYTLPAYYRKNFSTLEVTMLKYKAHTYTVPPVHASSEWIAHNAAMELKRPLLGQGEKPLIGRFFRPRIITTPAVERTPPPPPSVFRKRASFFAYGGAIFTLLALLGNLQG